MKLSRVIAACRRAVLASVCVAVLSVTTAAQIWIASTGAVDPSSASTYVFNGQLAFVKPSLATGTVTLRYNVLPVRDLIIPVKDPCCEGRALMVRFLDNGSGAQVLVRLKRYDVRTGQVTTILTFDSNDYPPQSGFQEPVPGANSREEGFFNFDFAEGPAEGPDVFGGTGAYYIEAKLIRSSAGGTPGLGSIRLVRVLFP